MKQYCKFSSNLVLIGINVVALLIVLTQEVKANNMVPHTICMNLTSYQDTVKPVNKIDSLTLKQLTIADTISIKVSKNAIEGIVSYEAKDSVVILVKDKIINLYGKTKVDYLDIVLTAPAIRINSNEQLLTANNQKDSSGNILNRVGFVQGDMNFESDTIQFNFKTRKGLTKNTYTQQGEMYVFGENIKKIDNVTMFVSSGRFTTCNLDEPHFAFKTNKMKVINGKVAMSGPTHPEFEGVPIPIYLPFGIYPLSKRKHSGLLPASFARNEQFGLGLEGLGYYKVLSEYFDVALRGNIYSYGGYSFNITPTYRKLYKYNGTLNFSYQVTKANFKGDQDFLKNKSFMLNWNHAVDQKARPGTNFSANVSAGSSKFNRYVTNNNQTNFQNQLNSSITYSKTWVGKPYNLTMSANHSQNNSTGLVNLSLPDAGFTVNTLYPFQKKESVGTPKWYEKLGIAYNGNFKNQVSFYDSLFSFSKLIDTLQWGARHSIPITLSLPALGPFIIAPNISYDEVWIQQKIRKTWNPASSKIDTMVTKGLFTDRSMAFGVGVNTAIYGTYQFKNSKIIALRHVMRPTISANYKPDMSKKRFYESQINTNGDKLRFSEFEGGVMSGFPEGVFGGIAFGVDNNLEMKVRSKKDTSDAKNLKIKLIDGFGFNGAYNIMADSFNLTDINLYLRSNLFEKINITANANLDPYQVSDRGFRVNKFAWQDGKFNLGTLKSGGISMSTDFKSKPKDPKKEEEKKKQLKEQANDPLMAADQQAMLEYMRKNPSEFVDFNIPWSISISYSLNFSKQLKSDYSGYETIINSNANFNGSFSLAPKWNINTNGYYDFKTRKLQTLQLSISREMHCWQMSIGVTPVGITRSFNISLSPKASILQDLKINRSRYFSSF